MTDIVDARHFQDLARKNPTEVCQRAKCSYDDRDKSYSGILWDTTYTITPGQALIECAAGTNTRLHPYFDLFIIQYLLQAKAVEPAKEWISEKDIPGGSTFFRGPHQIPTDLIAGKFVNNVEMFKNRCRQLEGISLDMADAACCFTITPAIPVAVLYWAGDDEFPAESRILFDATIDQHLALDIIFALSVAVCERLAS